MRTRPEAHADVVLVSMPWDMLECPSIQIGTLEAVLQREGCAVTSRAYKFDFIDRCIANTAERAEEERLTAEHYFRIALSCESALGDWVFAVPPYAEANAAREQAYFDVLRRRGVDEDLLRIARRFREHVTPFVDECVDDLVASGARVVGFSSTFSQNIATLLTAKLLKARAPEVTIVLGGSNCDGAMGAALHRAFPCIDYVVRGEGERVFPTLLREILADRPAPPLPGLCRREDGRSVAEAERSETVPMSEVPMPVFDEYFASFEASLARPQISSDVRLMVETSRGCWWGEKAHCTFCGLNGLTMKYRSKAPERAVAEIEELARRYKRLDFQVVDNILDMAYLRDVLPKLRDSGFDMTLFYETKSNLRRDQVKLLADSGVERIQPGIESLSTPILKLMRKGVTAFQNIRLLKWAAEYGVTVYWNVILGFPGEPIEEYAKMAELVPSLTHFDAPEIGNLRVDRFSPYHKDPAAHGIEILGPRAHFACLYDVDPKTLEDLAYTFEYRHTDGRNPDDYTGPLRAAVKAWREHRNDGWLVWRRGPGFVVVSDRRSGLAPNDFYLDDEAAIAFEACNDGATPDAVARAIRDKGLACPPLSEIEALLAQFVELRLAICEDDKYLTLAVPTRARAVADVSEASNVQSAERKIRTLPLAG